MRLVPKSISNLEKYGFIKEKITETWKVNSMGEYEWHLYNGKIKNGRPQWNIAIKEKDHHIVYIGYSMLVLETLCKMYKDGVIDFTDPTKDKLESNKKKLAQLEKKVQELKNEINGRTNHQTHD